MTFPEDDWLRSTLDLLATFQFSTAAATILSSTPLRPVPAAALRHARGAGISIPVDLDSSVIPDRPWSIPFGSTVIRVWSPIECPGPGWSAIPGESTRAWWRHDSGALIPAWNLWGNLKNLLTFQEEQQNPMRDVHGRFPVEASPRFAAGLLKVPAANDANALLLDAATALQANGIPRLRLDPALVRPPGLALSHDCDQLVGNDRYTQAVRGLRVIRELAAGHAGQSVRHARAITGNIVTPRTFFANNLTGMMDLERQFGFSSVAYFLTGRGGRFGARSGTDVALRAAAAMPRGWETGVHYNYWTVGSDAVLREEMAAVGSATGTPVIAGRAHYLRFNPVSDPPFLGRNGIRFDESIGWAGHLSFRAGIAGPFFPFDQTRQERISVLEMPMVCMDAALSADEASFRNLWDHLRVVGGVLSVLVHPGSFFNPEYPQFTGQYERLLALAYGHGARSWTPSEMLEATARHSADRSANPEGENSRPG